MPILDLEIDMRRQARIQLRFKQSRLLEQSTIDQFDFNHHVSRKNHKNTILGLLDLEFIRKKMDIILIGNPGVGNYAKLCIMEKASWLKSSLMPLPRPG